MKYIIGLKATSIFLALLFFTAAAIVVVPVDAAAQIFFCSSAQAGDYTVETCPGQAPIYTDSEGNVVDKADVSDEAREQAALQAMTLALMGSLMAGSEPDSDAKHRQDIDERLDKAQQQLWAGDYKKTLKSV